MRYPQTFIDDLKRQADIVRVIQDYVQLKKKGTNWMACCPFHKEKTPSFSVSPVKEIFYCFGCHKGGNVINFVMEMERVSFPEAIKLVAEKSGVPLPVMVDDSRFQARRLESEEVIELNKWALEWWEQQLESSPEGRIARDYLQGREITEETRKTFRLGYAPDSWDALSSHLRQKGASQEQIDRSGLVAKKEAGRSYDRFRGRLIFPVMDIQGKPIAFGGRTLKNEDAKYINSPETAAYVKGRNLFGLNLTRDEIRRNGFAILVEGFLDLIVPYQFGIRNVAASLGTALTPDQVKVLGRFARKVVVNYDGDSAGVQAAKKSIEILLAEDLEVKILVLPDGADPDEFLRKSGASEYHRRRGEAQPHIQFVIDQAVRDRKLSNPADKEAAIDEVLPYIRAVRSRLQKREYFDIAMDSLRITDATVKRELWHSIRVGISDRPRIGEQTVRRPGLKPTVAEAKLLEMLLADEGLRDTVLPKLEPGDYEGLPTAPVFLALVDGQREGVVIDFDFLSKKTEGDPISELLPSLLMSADEVSEDRQLEVRQLDAQRCIDALRLMNVDRRLSDLRSEIAVAERNGEIEERDRLSLEHLELIRRRDGLLPKAEAMQIGH
ncbi:MAG TPA: DNA primase [Pyrinomonadaceae bacterium]|nr:DNA primase [Pyrinomonadaceae bacterium]